METAKSFCVILFFETPYKQFVIVKCIEIKFAHLAHNIQGNLLNNLHYSLKKEECKQHIILTYCKSNSLSFSNFYNNSSIQKELMLDKLYSKLLDKISFHWYKLNIFNYRKYHIKMGKIHKYDLWYHYSIELGIHWCIVNLVKIYQNSISYISLIIQNNSCMATCIINKS